MRLEQYKHFRTHATSDFDFLFFEVGTIIFKIWYLNKINDSLKISGEK